MKYISHLLLALFALNIAAFGASNPQGIIVFTEPPLKYVMIREFASFTRQNVQYSSFTGVDGESVRLENSGILGIINYPPEEISSISEEQVTLTIQQIQELQQKVGRRDLDKVFQAAKSKWQNALAVAQQAAKARPAIATPKQSGVSITVDGSKYEDVTLTSVVAEIASLRHSGGVARIPISVLDKTQIEALNKTTTAVRIDPDWRAKKEAKEKEMQAQAEKKQEEATAANPFPALFFLLHEPQASDARPQSPQASAGTPVAKKDNPGTATSGGKHEVILTNFDFNKAAKGNYTYTGEIKSADSLANGGSGQGGSTSENRAQTDQGKAKIQSDLVMLIPKTLTNWNALTPEAKMAFNKLMATVVRKDNGNAPALTSTQMRNEIGPSAALGIFYAANGELVSVDEARSIVNIIVKYSAANTQEEKTALGLKVAATFFGKSPEPLLKMNGPGVSVIVKNETGYDLSQVKYVQETGNSKIQVGFTSKLSNGDSHTFSLNESGDYRVYAALTMEGAKVFAKGNAYNLKNGTRCALTLKKVITNSSGSGLDFITQSEFDAIK